MGAGPSSLLEKYFTMHRKGINTADSKAVQKRAAKVEKITLELFNALDTDKSGQLEKNEILATWAVVSKVWKKVATNRHGKDAKGYLTKSMFDGIVVKVDDNEDGKVSLKEFGDLLRELKTLKFKASQLGATRRSPFG